MNFPEEFLHFIWQFRLYGNQPLLTLEGERIHVIHQGILNKDAGPDFSNAKVRIENTTWAGNIEIHIKSSDWYLHNHQFNEAYENVILHVVYENDKPIFRKDGTLLPVLIIKNLFPQSLLDRYEGLVNSVSAFPCEKQIAQVDPIIIQTLLSRVLVERMVYKSLDIEQKMKDLKGDWEAAFYHFLARSFGFKVNALPMEILAQSLPLQLLAKHRDQPLQIEALLFGQAGFLNQRFKEPYPKTLKREYLFLKKKYQLQPIDPSLWKFMRMRPQNFPTLRLAQFAALISSSNQLFSKIINTKLSGNVLHFFEKLPINAFWETHYHFNSTTTNVKIQIGKTSIHHVAINTLSLFLFTYGKSLDQYSYVKMAISILEALPAENNSILKQYIEAGVQVNSAFDSQAILQLKKMYCNEKKCLNCTIGIKILKP